MGIEALYDEDVKRHYATFLYILHHGVAADRAHIPGDPGITKALNPRYIQP